MHTFVMFLCPDGQPHVDLPHHDPGHVPQDEGDGHHNGHFRPLCQLAYVGSVHLNTFNK